MAFKLKIKKGTSAPASGALDSGELGYNTNSNIAYVGNGTGNAATEIITNSSTAQTKVGNFVTQGKLGGEYLELETLTGSTPTAGQLTYETDSGTFRAGIAGNYVLDLGEKQVYYVENATGSTITKGTVVGFSGSSGDHLRAAPYIADSSANPQYIMGIADQTIANGDFGFVVIIGKVRGIDTSAYAPGTLLYVSSATAGQLTSTKPTSPNRRFAIAAVVKQNASSGIIQVRVEPGVLLDDVHDVFISSPASGNTLIYDAAQSRWENAALTAGNAITITNGAGSISIAHSDTSSQNSVDNSGVDYIQDVTLDTYGHVTGLTSATIRDASGSQSGLVSTGTQTFAGAKSFSGSITLSASGPTDALILNNNNITGVNNIIITDPGPDEGITWSGGNSWKIYESPNDLTTNTGGNLQIVQSTTRRATFNTSGQLEIPVTTGTAPFSITSTTAVTNLNADLLDGQHGSYYAVDSAVVKLTGDQTIAGSKTFSNDVIITGNLTINGTTTNVNTTNLVVEDKNIIIGDVATPTDVTAAGGGITLKGATDKTITWNNANAGWEFNQTITTTGSIGIGTTSPSSKLHVIGSSTTSDWLSLFAENGVTPEASVISGLAANKAVSVQANGAAYFMGRDVTNDIEFIMGTSSAGLAFAGAMTSHDFQLRTNNTARLTVKATTGDVGIGTTTPSEKLEVSGNIKHTGLVMTDGTNVDQLKTTTFTSALTTSWTDVTGVSGTYLATGSYIVQIESNGEYYTGNMSWFSGSTTSTVADEMELHRAGPAASAARIYARVLRVSSGTLKLQVSASTSLSSHTMTFKFRRTI